jgi:putative transposase
MLTNPREERGRAIAGEDDQIRRASSTRYFVKSQSGHGQYKVLQRSLGWTCTCPDFQYREVKCKHIWAVEFSVKVRKEVEARVIQPIANIHACLLCGSERIVKDGVRHNEFGDIQKFNCKDCGKYFTINIGFEKMKHNPQGITTAMQLYFSGESLRNVARSLKLIGVEVSHQTIYNWIQKYVSLMQKYLDKIKPNVSDTWRADELWLKVRGNMKYLFALMDDETRFWIAQEVAETKYTHDARTLLRIASQIAGKKPSTLITDGLMSYHDAFLREYYRHELPKPQHIRHIRIQGQHNNNKMERLNGEIRDREKVMRGLKQKDTPILKGCQIFHNYVRPHEALDGQTPAEVCGIKIEGKNKWMTIIQNAAEKP